MFTDGFPFQCRLTTVAYLRHFQMDCQQIVLRMVLDSKWRHLMIAGMIAARRSGFVSRTAGNVQPCNISVSLDGIVFANAAWALYGRYIDLISCVWFLFVERCEVFSLQLRFRFSHS